jgi:enamine deaminase RidA (YjgF/YER057c/UK114 family)
MTKRTNYQTGAKWESIVGYSRAVRIGNIIEVSGTVAIENGQIIGQNDPYLQSKKIIEILIRSVEQLGGTKEDIIRTRCYVTNIDQWEDVGRAHVEAFSKVMPATSMVEVSGLISPEFLVEIEATAIL